MCLCTCGCSTAGWNPPGGWENADGRLEGREWRYAAPVAGFSTSARNTPTIKSMAARISKFIVRWWSCWCRVRGASEHHCSVTKPPPWLLSQKDVSYICCCQLTSHTWKEEGIIWFCLKPRHTFLNNNDIAKTEWPNKLCNCEYNSWAFCAFDIYSTI